MVTLSKSAITAEKQGKAGEFQGNDAMRHCSLGPLPTQPHRREMNKQPFGNTAMEVHSSTERNPKPKAAGADAWHAHNRTAEIPKVCVNTVPVVWEVIPVSTWMLGA